MGRVVERKFVVTVRFGSRDYPQPSVEEIKSLLEPHFDRVEVEEVEEE